VGVAGAVAGTFGIQPLVGAFGVPYQAAEPRDERQIRVPLRITGRIKGWPASCNVLSKDQLSLSV